MKLSFIILLIRYVFPGAEIYPEPDSSDDEEEDDLEERNEGDSRAETRDEEQERDLGLDSTDNDVDNETTAYTDPALSEQELVPELSSTSVPDKPAENIDSEKEKQPM